MCAGGLLLAYASTLERGSLFERLRRLAPFALISLGWCTTYRLQGHGSVGSGFYIDPGNEPLRFACSVLTGVPIHMASQLTWPIASLASLSDTWFAVVLGSSLAILGCAGAPLPPLLRTSRTARFLGPGAVLAASPLDELACRPARLSDRRCRPARHAGDTTL